MADYAWCSFWLRKCYHGWLCVLPILAVTAEWLRCLSYCFVIADHACCPTWLYCPWWLLFVNYQPRLLPVRVVAVFIIECSWSMLIVMLHPWIMLATLLLLMLTVMGNTLQCTVTWTHQILIIDFWDFEFQMNFVNTLDYGHAFRNTFMPRFYQSYSNNFDFTWWSCLLH